jgi:uncharacterized protein (TIGR03086 family)
VGDGVVTAVLDRYQRVSHGLGRRLAAAAPERWEAISPCEPWTARDVARHVVDTHHRVLGALTGSAPPPLADDVRPDELVAAWQSVSAEVQEALADAERASTVVGGMFGEQPWEQLVGRLLCADTLIHTWDFARATGQDDILDPEAVAAALGFLTPLDEVIRRPGGFGPKVTPPPGADEQARLLAFVGRRA